MAIEAAKGPVGPSPKTVEDGTYQPLVPADLHLRQQEIPGHKPEVKEFVDFYLKNASKLVKDVKYVALPPSAYTIGAEHVSKGKIGTVFGGTAEVGVKIEDLMKREASF